MALISCPQCGGKVSDSAQKCVHCGYDFLKAKQEEEKTKEKEHEAAVFNNLPEYEQKSILNEYYAKFPEEAKSAKICKLYKWSGIIIVILFAVFFIAESVIVPLICFSKINPTKGLTLATFFGLPGIVVCVLSVILRISKKKIDTMSCRNIKRFGKWLKNEKKLIYKLTLSKEEKAVFDSVQI